MRFGYVLLGLVTLSSIHVSSGQCSNGLVGVQRDEVCCDVGCGTCGGAGCSKLPGGSANCCVTRIRESGVMCGDSEAAPCLVESESVCDNGLSGVQTGDICCDSSCGTCGGAGCSKLQGGSDACCTSRIRDAGLMCDTTGAAPCIIDAEPVDTTCDNGLPGIQDGNICCDASCGTCGGSGCAKRPGGSAACCTSRISESAMYCDTTGAAPCIVNDVTDEPTAAPTVPATTAPPTEAPTDAPVPTCSNGFPGVESNGVCCNASCGVCGGPGCGELPGGSENCCSNVILNSGDQCSVSMAAPCIIIDATEEPTAAPTVAETTAPPTEAPTAEPTAAPTTAPPTEAPTDAPTDAPVPTCSNGYPGLENAGICCEVSCGTCGGPGCGTFPGGASNCCNNVINNSGTACSVALAAPCIIDN